MDNMVAECCNSINRPYWTTIHLLIIDPNQFIMRNGRHRKFTSHVVSQKKSNSCFWYCHFLNCSWIKNFYLIYVKLLQIVTNRLKIMYIKFHSHMLNIPKDMATCCRGLIFFGPPCIYVYIYIYYLILL